MVNGVTKSCFWLAIPILGSQAMGRIPLVANQDEVMLLEVDMGGCIIVVPLDKRRRPDEVIDAEVLIIQTNAHYSAAYLSYNNALNECH